VRPFNKLAERRSLWLPLACAACLAALALACSRPASEEAAGEAPTIVADTGKVTRQDVSQVLTLRGTIAARPNEDVKISALVPGRVIAVRAAEGDAVSDGQVVAEIDAQPYEDQQRQAKAALAQAAAKLENARLNLPRTERLLERGIAAAKEVEDARADLAAAQAGVEEAQAALNAATLQLSRTKVASPIAGIVVKRLVSVGEQVDGTAAQPIIEVANLDEVELAANLPSGQLSQIKVGAKVSIVPDAYADRSFEGTLIAIAPAIDPTTNAALARIRAANPGHLLKMGMFAQARVVVVEHKGALVVPAAAVVRDEAGQAAVYVVKGETAERVAVTTGIEVAGAVEVMSGVSEGQTVLTSAVHGLGDKVRLGHKQ
jgi:membrane fusion protein, multidrug efflux system